MRGPKQPRIKEKPGTCGGGGPFSGGYNGTGPPPAAGTRPGQPGGWGGLQCKKACKKYKGKEETDNDG